MVITIRALLPATAVAFGGASPPAPQDLACKTSCHAATLGSAREIRRFRLLCAMRLDRRAIATLASVAALLAFANGARAQTEMPGAAPYAPPATVEAPPVEAAAPRVPLADPHDQVLRRLLRSGCRDGLLEARDLAASGGVTWAETVTRLCGEILREQAAPFQRTNGPSAERDGRGILVIYSTIYGIWAGIAFDVIFKVDDARPAILAPLLGMGVGLALSLGLTNDRPVTSGQSWAINTGLDYGSFNGAFWAGAWGFGAQHVVGTALATGVAGGAAGLLVANHFVPPQGDVEVVRSGLLWGTVGGLLGVATFAPTSNSDTVFRAAAVAMDLGFIAGLALASSFEVSRTRDLIIDAGTLGGGVAGLGIAVLAMGANGSGRAVAAGGLAGMMAGMLATIFLTRDMDRDDDDERAPVAALLGRDGRGRWRWGTPGPTPVFDGLGRRVIGATFTALGGTF